MGPGVLGSAELALVEGAVQDAAAGRREHPRIAAAGQPTDLESFLAEVLDRRPGHSTPRCDAAS